MRESFFKWNRSSFFFFSFFYIPSLRLYYSFLSRSRLSWEVKHWEFLNVLRGRCETTNITFYHHISRADESTFYAYDPGKKIV